MSLARRATDEDFWRVTKAPVFYEDAVARMESRVADICAGRAGNQVWLLEHPPLYTAGTSADPADLLNPAFPVFETGRGGQYTYHGPGQRIAYVMMDLRPCGSDLRQYICDLEEWVIRALADFGVKCERRPGRVGLWVAHADGEDKIAAIGVRVRRWVAFHGVSINLSPDLSHYAGIVPCGIRGHGVTSLQKLGIPATLPDLDAALMKRWSEVFE